MQQKLCFYIEIKVMFLFLLKKIFPLFELSIILIQQIIICVVLLENILTLRDNFVMNHLFLKKI